MSKGSPWFDWIEQFNRHCCKQGYCEIPPTFWGVDDPYPRFTVQYHLQSAQPDATFRLEYWRSLPPSLHQEDDRP